MWRKLVCPAIGADSPAISSSDAIVGKVAGTVAGLQIHTGTSLRINIVAQSRISYVIEEACAVGPGNTCCCEINFIYKAASIRLTVSISLTHGPSCSSKKVSCC